MDKDEKLSIVLYPNPANDLLTITLDQIRAINKSILTVYSIEGRMLLQQFITQNKTELDISGLSNGIYFIKVTGSDKSSILKFVKNERH